MAKRVCKSENTFSADAEDGWTSKMSVIALTQVGIKDAYYSHWSIHFAYYPPYVDYSQNYVIVIPRLPCFIVDNHPETRGHSPRARAWLSTINHGNRGISVIYSPLQPCFYSNRWVINSIYWQEVTYTPALRAIRIDSALIDCSLFRLPC